MFGGVRWLLAVYFKQQLKLDAARKTAYAAGTKLLENRIMDLETKISDMKYELEKFSVRMEEMSLAFDGTKESSDRVYTAFREYIVEVNKKFKKIDTVQDPATYNSVEVKEDKKVNVGKVIVKK